MANIGPFFYLDSDVPQMCADEIRDHIEAIDNRVYFDYLHCVDPDDRMKRESLIGYLREYEPALYDTLEGILRAYQTAFHSAQETRASLIKSYQRFRVARDMVDVQGRDVVAEIIEAAAQPEAPKKKKNSEKKRTREEHVAEEEQLFEQTKNAAKVLRASVDPAFWAQEKFSADFPFQEYVHFVQKGKTRWNLQDLDAKGIWDTIYHVNGPWKAEELRDQLELDGKKAIIIKRIRGSMDQEMMSYKVLAGY